MPEVVINKYGKVYFLNKKINGVLPTPKGHRLLIKASVLENSGGNIHLAKTELEVIADEILFQ